MTKKKSQDAKMKEKTMNKWHKGKACHCVHQNCEHKIYKDQEHVLLPSAMQGCPS